jgi:hypothetical protein
MHWHDVRGRQYPDAVLASVLSAMNRNLDEQLAEEAGRWVHTSLRSAKLRGLCREQFEEWLHTFRLEVCRLPSALHFWRELLKPKKR